LPYILTNANNGNALIQFRITILKRNVDWFGRGIKRIGKIIGIENQGMIF